MGVASMPLLVEILVGRLGVRNALRIASAFVATLVLCALVWRPTYQRDVTAQPRSGRLARVGRFFNYSIWTNAEYALWSAAMVLSAIGRLVPVMYMVRRPFCVAVVDRVGDCWCCVYKSGGFNSGGDFVMLQSIFIC